MRTLRRRITAGAILVAAALAIGLTIAVPSLRSAAATAALKIALRQRGFAVRSVQLRIAGDTVDAAGVAIEDAYGNTVFTADRISASLDSGVWLGRSDRRYGLESLDVEHPVLHAVQLADGSYNLSPLFSEATSASPASPLAPIRADIRIADATFDFRNPSATEKLGRRFFVERFDAKGRIDQGGVTTLDVRATYVAGARRSPVTIDVFEDDRTRFARAQLRAAPVFLAPIVDGLVPTPAFAIEDGTLSDVRLQAFSIGYDPAAGPQWSLSGTAELSGGRFRVLPLTAPVTGVNGPLAFAGGNLATTALRGTLEGSPVVIRGGLRLLGGVQLGIFAHSRQSLATLKRAFAFSTDLDVAGPVDVDLRVDGAPATVDVAARYRSAGQLAYSGLPLTSLAGTLFYNNGHVTLPVVDGRYDGATIALAGDVDLTADVTTGAFDVIATMPSARLPIAANVNPEGLARALVTVDGPIGALAGWGYAEVVGGNGTLARTSVYAGPRRFAVGPAIVSDPHGGELLASGGIDRTTPRRSVSGEIVARAASLRLVAGAQSLPGINDAAPIALPAVDGTLDGTIFVRGDERSPAVYLDTRAEGLVVSGARLGHVELVASGARGRVRIARATISGPDVEATANGSAAIAPHSGAYVAVLEGDGRANLGALGLGPMQTRMQGTASGHFSAALAGGRWTVALHATSADARVAGVRVETVDASVGGGGGGTTDVYASTSRIAGGVVSAMGALPAATRPDGDLRVWTDGLDLGAFAPAPSHVTTGRAVAIMRVTGSLAALGIAGAASVENANVNGQPLGGDVNLEYKADRLVASDGRLSMGNNFADVSGTLTGLRPDKPLGGAGLSIVASMREGDLAALAGRYMPKPLDLRGTVAGTLLVGGTLAAPHATGYVNADSGTLQGVAFENLRGSIAASASALQVSDGEVAIGSSSFRFAGSLSPSVVHIRAASPRVDLSDFNDFFAGYDTLEGTGSGEIGFESTRTAIIGSGRIDLVRASVGGFPLGTVDADFSSRRDEMLAHVRQTGVAGSSDLRGSVSFAPRRSALPALKTARFDVRGSVRGADLGRIAPLAGKERLGLTGLIDLDGALHGDLKAPAGRAQFTLHDGHIGKVAVTAATGTLDTDGKVVALRNAVVALPFAHIEGEGTIGPGKRIAASASIDASDLGTLFALGGKPGIATGSALASVNVTGTLTSPRVATTVVSGLGSAFGVRFDRLNGKVTYEPGEVDIADAQVDLAGNRGAIRIAGTLPLQLQPFGLGPKEKRVDLALMATAVDLSALDPLASGYASLTGMLDANGNLSGSAGRPQVTGSARLRNASVLSPYDTVPAEHLDADLSLAKDTLTLTRLTADLGRGTLRGSGAIHIVPAVGLLNVAGLQYWTRLDVHNAQINVPGWTSGLVNGNLRLTKSGSTPYLSGDLTLDDGTVPFAAIYRLASGYGSGPAPAAGPLPGVPELLPGHIVVYGGGVFGLGGPYVLGAFAGATPAPTGPELPSVDLAVNARAGRNVRVHGGAIDLTTSGAVLLGGNLRSPTLAGTFTSTRGQIGYFDTNFRLVRGTVIFDPIEGLLPTLDVRAITNLGGSEITLTVTGRVDNLQTDLSSNPSMARDEIIATLLHAPQVESVIGSTPSQAQTALYTEAQSYFNAQLTRSLLFPVESLLAQTINVEQISLIYDQQGNVDVEIRKLVTPTVYAIYRSSLNIPVTQTAGVAYSLRDYADLEILQTQSSTGLQQSVLNLRLTFH